MMVFLLILILLAILAWAALWTPAQICFELDSNRNLLRGQAVWLRILRAEALTDELGISVTVMLGDRQIARRHVSGHKKGGHGLRALSLQQVLLKADYGLEQPHLTGLLCGLAAVLGEMLPDTVLEQKAHFAPQNPYLCIEGSARLHLGKTLLNMTRQKVGKRKVRYDYGAA
ncbi:hypothetical protein SDC9_68541 [bioreactor metagenome]|uniref:DUF2953 domain-containing protein n=1 Tax=bioreactor metagenome TaxID=1076179 RepID=A0A644Y2D9_9ZZZZ